MYRWASTYGLAPGGLQELIIAIARSWQLTPTSGCRNAGCVHRLSMSVVKLTLKDGSAMVLFLSANEANTQEMHKDTSFDHITPVLMTSKGAVYTQPTLPVRNAVVHTLLSGSLQVLHDQAVASAPSPGAVLSSVSMVPQLTPAPGMMTAMCARTTPH